MPVWVKGALLWTGDSHAAQGNGEVNLTAVETAYKEMAVNVTVLKDMKLDMPRIETPTHWITMGFDRDLNLAWNQALAADDQVHRRAAPHLRRRGRRAVMAQRLRLPRLAGGQHQEGHPLPHAEGHLARPASPSAPPPRLATYYVTTGRDADLNKAMDGASMAMIKFLEEKKGIARLDAYGLASVAMDCRVGDMSGAEKNVHCVMPKSLWRK